jgi:mono/diheme cytochrome c family protein
VYLTDRSGKPLTNADRVSLRFNMLTMDMGESEAFATSQGDGHYVTQGGNMAMPGQWQVTVLVRRSGQDDVRVNTMMGIQPTPPPNMSPAAPLIGEANVVLGAELLLAGLMAVGFAVRGFRTRSRVVRWAAPLAAFALIFGGSLTVQGTRALAVSGVQNPIAPTQASISRGQEIYVDSCATCHGINGRGDGPAGLSLVPRPADFRTHLQAGHTDAQLFDWVSNGFPGSAMPAWKNNLGEEDRWNVINYIKATFGQSPAAGR